MEIYLTRHSVCAGDDVDAPHVHELHASDNPTVSDVVSLICRAGYLPRIAGGKATWCVSSGVPLAVVAEQWAGPKMTQPIPPRIEELDVSEGTLFVHVTYYAQLDPNVVWEVLRRLQVKVYRSPDDE
jgi:hypothetical protein